MIQCWAKHRIIAEDADVARLVGVKARFYLVLHECGTVLDDEEGQDLPNLNAAHARAVIEARQIMSDEVRDGRLCLSCCIVIHDADGREQARVHFREAVEVSGMS